jgi:hypothetical protein
MAGLVGGGVIYMLVYESWRTHGFLMLSGVAICVGCILLIGAWEDE